jgi:hypothetical protein
MLVRVPVVVDTGSGRSLTLPYKGVERAEQRYRVVSAVITDGRRVTEMAAAVGGQTHLLVESASAVSRSHTCC